jgi:hypothetical protein
LEPCGFKEGVGLDRLTRCQLLGCPLVGGLEEDLEFPLGENVAEFYRDCSPEIVRLASELEARCSVHLGVLHGQCLYQLVPPFCTNG